VTDPNEAHTVRPGCRRAVVLVGHGGVPTDFSRAKVRRLMTLEGERRSSGRPMSDEECALDAELRSHPRTPRTDPYQAGLECLAGALRTRLPDAALYLAYNEFCAPSVPEAVERAIAAGAEDVVLLSSMMTPGGSHSEVEIPELVAELQQAHPEVSIRYAWPFDVREVAALMAAQVARFAQRIAAE
jgi:sirohydrochlorin cobaltochelatase